MKFSHLPCLFGPALSLDYRMRTIIDYKLAAEKKYSKNGAAGKYFGPSYFDPAFWCCFLNHKCAGGKFPQN